MAAMANRYNDSLPGWIRHFPLVTAACVIAIGAAALLGWYRGLELLRSVSPQFVSMKANAAGAFLLLGLALTLATARQNTVVAGLRWAFELTAFAVGLLTVVQYVFDVDLHIDLVLIAAPLNEFQTASPGRMSVVTAIGLMLCATALFAERDRSARGRAVSRTLAMCAGIVGLLSFLGYLYGAPVLFRPTVNTSAMAIHDAVAFMLLGTGITALHPQYGLPSIASGRTLVGTHVRWLFPLAVLIPLLLGGLAVQAYVAFGAARASIALTAAGTTITIGLAIAFAALWLRRMEDRLEISNRALATTRQGVFIANGNVPGRPITYVNDAFTQLSGYPPKEAIGRPCDFLVEATSEDPQLAVLAKSLAERDSCTVTLPCRRRDGTVFSGRWSISAVPGADGANDIIGLLEDVTAEQLAAMARLELLAEASQARKDAEAANRAKDTFFASITHDLRSPMNACLMWLDVLALGPQSEKSTKAIDAIKRNLKVQARLVNDLIDAAKISSGGIEIHADLIELETLVEGHVETWQLMAAGKHVGFDYVPDSHRHRVNADTERLLQVLNNLLENAFNHTPKGGNVTLRVESRGAHVAVTVRDDGTGLSAEDLGRVFTPFWRLRTPGNDHKGLGLGLAIAEHLVKGHGGELSVDSEGLGKGCTFTVLLPAVDALDADPDASGHAHSAR
jgi:PAS domain S-box-containing protein